MIYFGTYEGWCHGATSEPFVTQTNEFLHKIARITPLNHKSIHCISLLNWSAYSVEIVNDGGSEFKCDWHSSKNDHTGGVPPIVTSQEKTS